MHWYVLCPCISYVRTPSQAPQLDAGLYIFRAKRFRLPLAGFESGTLALWDSFFASSFAAGYVDGADVGFCSFSRLSLKKSCPSACGGLFNVPGSVPDNFEMLLRESFGRSPSRTRVGRFIDEPRNMFFVRFLFFFVWPTPIFFNWVFSFFRLFLGSRVCWGKIKTTRKVYPSGLQDFFCFAWPICLTVIRNVFT
jgi:hypothetical protein